MQEEDHRKLLAAGCAAVFEPASLYHSGIEQFVFMMLQECAPYAHPMYEQEGGRAALHALYPQCGLYSCGEPSACSPGACACIATADSAY